ncbi:MAG TPA: SMC family ATPase [Trebonia sp.]|nr:SMC family ATPase [Trebonia sp.]
MRPHRLRVTAFGAFAGTEQVTFDDLEGLFLLHGETGAGKTTLLDAIAFALYGRVPGERGTARRLRSDHAATGTATEVELEATIGGRRLRITRKPEQTRPKRSGTGITTEQASVRLAELGPDGSWESKSTRIGEVDAEIENLMGMSATQFFQVVLLPQGEFAKFLRADAKDKEALLQKLFGTDRFRKVEDWLADRRRATDKEVTAAETDVTRLVAQIAQAAGTAVPNSAAVLDSPEWAAPLSAGSGASHAWQATWTAALEAAAAAERDAAAAVVAARKTDLETRLAAQRQAEQLADRQRRRGDALRRQAELEAAAPEIEQLRTAANARGRAADARTGAAAAAGDVGVAAVAARVAEAAALHAVGQEQQAQVGRLEALRTVARQADAEDETAATARARAAELTAELDLAKAEAQQRQAARPAAEQARDEASRAAAALPASQTMANAARQVASDCAALVTEHAKRSQLREAHLTAREQAVSAQDAALRVREARIDGMRAELAAQMTDGSPCPVCGSLDHPDPVDATSFPPVSQGDEDTAFQLASDAAEAAARAGRRVAAVDAVLADLTQRLTEAGFAFPASAAGGDAATSTAGPSKAALATTVPLSSEVLADAARAAEADADSREAEAALLRAAAARLTSLQAELDDLDEAIADDKAWLTELTEQRTAALAEADAAATRAAARRAELAAQLGDAGDLETAIDAASRLADTLLKAAAVADVLADPDLDVALDPPAQVDETTEAAEAAQEAHADAVDAHGQARLRAAQLAILGPQLQAALDALQPLQERAAQIRHLADLANGTSGANQYKMTLSSFVLAARLEEVAAAASERLLTMTAGRYSLVHSDTRKGNAKAGLSLLACDAWTGQDRDTATLSGGETFLASLSLALGLADVVTAESAGTPMEALFVDEGFGTLDEDTLDEVMNVLDGLRAGGRLVGIVSHVTELRQRIPAQIHVRKSRTGSHVEVTAG